MVDYAKTAVETSSNVEVDKNVSISTVRVPYPQLIIALLAACFLYVLGYQNSMIAQVQHGINLKKNKLIELNMAMNALEAQRAEILSSKSVIAGLSSKDMKIAKNIQIVY